MDYFDEFEDVTLFYDFHNITIRNFFGAKEILEDPDNPAWGLWRYNVFNQIYQALWKIKNVREVVIACDSTKSWRKSFYPRYKESRKKKKDDKIDWHELYKQINNLASELKHYFPFNVIRVQSAEADDIIGVLVKKMKNPCIIVSGDEDYQQLLKYKRVKIFDPYSHEFLPKSDDFDVKDFLIEKILCGQKKDDIPNILTPDDWGLTPETEGKRRPPFGKKKLLEVKPNLKNFINTPYKNKTYKKSIDLKRNLRRNRVLIDFDKIPKTIVSRIADEYNKNGDYPPIDNMFGFFQKYSMRSFIEDITRVEDKFRSLFYG